MSYFFLRTVRSSFIYIKLLFCYEGNASDSFYPFPRTKIKLISFYTVGEEESSLEPLGCLTGLIIELI